MNKKFLTLIENAIVRNTNGGLLVGDVVKFVDNFKRKDEFKSLPQCTKNVILKLTSTDLNLFITAIKTEYPSSQPGNENNRGGCFYVEIAPELAPGMLDRQCKVVVCNTLVCCDNNYPNLPKIPDSFRRKDKINMKPVIYKMGEENEEVINDPCNQTCKTQQGDDLQPSDLSLPTKNTILPNVTAKDPKIQKIQESSIVNYMRGY